MTLTKNMKKLLLSCAAACVAVAVYAGQYPEIKIDELKTALTSKNVTVNRAGDVSLFPGVSPIGIEDGDVLRGDGGFELVDFDFGILPGINRDCDTSRRTGKKKFFHIFC